MHQQQGLRKKKEQLQHSNKTHPAGFGDASAGVYRCAEFAHPSDLMCTRGDANRLSTKQHCANYTCSKATRALLTAAAYVCIASSLHHPQAHSQLIDRFLQARNHNAGPLSFFRWCARQARGAAAGQQRWCFSRACTDSSSSCRQQRPAAAAGAQQQQGLCYQLA